MIVKYVTVYLALIHVIDLIFIGDFDKSYLTSLVEKAEKLIGRKIRYLLYDNEEASTINWLQYDPAPLLLWNRNTESNPSISHN